MSVREAIRPVELYGNGGELALQEINRNKTILANRTAPEIEAQIVEFSLEQPAFGRIRVAKKADRKSALSQKILNIPIAQREPKVEPDSMSDDVRWKSWRA